MNSSRNDLLRDVFETMSVMKRVMHSSFTHAFEHGKLSPSEVQLLTIISLKQPISPTELASKMQLTPGAISQLLDSLEAARSISRTQSTTDRRVNYLSITKTGHHQLAEFDKIREQLFTKALSALTDTELRHYLKIQQKMVRNFEAERADIHKK